MMNWDEQLPEPPSDAYSDEHTREVNNDWLREAGNKDQVAAMAQWFLARFCHPAEETPYESSEGGYIWVYGGPYDAQEEIEGRFHGLVSSEVIDQTVELLQRDGIHEWAPTQLTYYDDFYDVDVDERNEPTRRLEARLMELRAVLGLQGSEEARRAARYLAYGGVIAALETFLWETMTYWIDHSEQTVKNLIVKYPRFRDQKINFGQIYDIKDRLVDKVKAHMQVVVWHRSDQVAPMFKYGLDVNLGFVGFDKAIRKRHDIVHRSGHKVDGNPIVISDKEVEELAERVLVFANGVDKKIAAKDQAHK